MVGAVADWLMNCTSLTPLPSLEINAVPFLTLAMMPPVGELIPFGAITKPGVAFSVIVTVELKLNDPKALVVGLTNGPDTKSQLPFWSPGFTARGPARTVTVLENGASKPPAVS